jgi:FdhD protein
MSAGPSPFEARVARKWRQADDAVEAISRDVPAETAVGLAYDSAFILITSRCSCEMVEKTAAAGVSILAAISAPTALAITQAETAGLTLAALARADDHTVFAGGRRIVAG